MYYLLGLFILRGGGEGEHGVEEAAGLDELLKAAELAQTAANEHSHGVEPAEDGLVQVMRDDYLGGVGDIQHSAHDLGGRGPVERGRGLVYEQDGRFF